MARCWVLGAATLLLAAGCKSLSCNNPERIPGAAEVKSLKMRLASMARTPARR
ncbi:MAG: hypothetical protein WDO12_12655 [Pseudomonadota bacterium]